MDYMGEFVVESLGKAGNKMTAVNAVGGQTWFVYNDKVNQIQPGMNVACQYSIGEGRDGKAPPYFVKKINTIQGAVPPAQAAPPIADSLPHPYAPPASPPPGYSSGAPSVGDTPPILSNAIGHYLNNPNCRFTFDTPEEFGQFVKRVQAGYSQ